MMNNFFDDEFFPPMITGPFRRMVFPFIDDELLGLPDVKPTSINYHETDENYIIEAAMPGFNKDEIKVQINDKRNSLVIDAKKLVEKTNENKAEDKTDDKAEDKVDDKTEDKKDEKSKTVTHVQEISTAIHREISLPKNIDKDSIKAKLDSGILTLTITKTEIPKLEPKMIDIE